jgi:regulator of cell morphogenesis and NO signaling
MDAEELDIRLLSPFDRKNSIIDNLDQLRRDQRLAVLFHYDPAVFLNFLERNRKGLFSAVKETEGPPVWRVGFMAISPDYTINELIVLNPSSIEIFEKYGIPYFVSGDKKVGDFLRNRQITHRDFVIEALRHTNHFFGLVKPMDWNIEFLISYIRENHHKNLLDKISGLYHRINIMEKLHGASFPLLAILEKEFRDFMFVQNDHFLEEEEYLFPLILSAIKNNSMDKSSSEMISEAMDWMAEDHQAIEANLQAIRKITNQFMSPDESIFEITLLFDDLRTFGYEYHYHMLLENFYLTEKLKNLNSL